MAVRRVAVLTPGDPLGDGLMRLPLLHGIRRRWPEHRVWWVAGGPTAMNGALAAHGKPHLERIVTDFKIERPAADVALAARDLPPFEIVFCIYSRMANVLAVKRILRPSQFYACLALQIGSTHRDPQWSVRRPAHMKARIRSMARAAGCEIPLIRDILPVSDAARRAAACIVRSDKPHVGFVISTANYQVGKAWPLARFIALGNLLLARGEQPVFLIGPAETALVDQIRAGVPEAILARLDQPDGKSGASGVDLCLALGERLSAAVATDTGLAHTLAVVGTPMVSLFGPTDPARWAPEVEPLITVRAQTFGSDRMEAIPLEPVAQALAKLLATVAK